MNYLTQRLLNFLPTRIMAYRQTTAPTGTKQEVTS
jgi:hypothetical protein